MAIERLDAAKVHLENQDPVKQFAIRQAKELLVAAGVKDPGPKIEPALASSAEVPAQPQIERPSLGLLEQAVREFKEKPHTPELVNRFWQTFLETSIESQGLDIPVPIVSCDRTQEELEALKKEGRMWIPETKLTYPQLGKIFPKTGSWALQEDSSIKDEYKEDAKGVDVEVDINAPNKNTTQQDLEKLFKKQGRNGMRLSTYILASQASKLLTNRYLDEGVTLSRLLGSRRGGRVVGANFNVNGSLRVDWSLDPQDRNSGLGGRSEGVKKA